MIYLRSRKLSNGKFSIYLDYYHQGKRFTETLPITVRKDYFGQSNVNTHPEDREKLKIANDALLTKQLDLAKVGGIQRISKEKLLPSFESFSKEKNHTTYTATFLKLQKFGENPSVGNIDASFLTRFQEFLQNEWLSNTSINVYMSRIVFFLRKAKDDKLISDVPKIKIVQPNKGRKTYLTAEEIILLNDTECENKDVKQAFLFSCFCGMRISDAKKLQWSEVESTDNEGIFLTFKQKKTKKDTRIPLSEQAYSFIQSQQKINELVFQLPKSDGHTWTIIQSWITAAKITKHISYHVSRHTFASLSRNNGLEMSFIKDFMGHDSIASTNVYTHISDGAMRKEIDKFPSILPKK